LKIEAMTRTKAASPAGRGIWWKSFQQLPGNLQQEIIMTQRTRDAQASETAGLNIEDRREELAEQHWTRNKSAVLAKSEGLRLSDAHWAVIQYLRSRYLKLGTPKHARTLARELDRHFSAQGGNRYLHYLFADGPVTQGSRLASLRMPANANDLSFGSSY
jgi:tRNA 2-thiouridine synthesizing protein E